MALTNDELKQSPTVERYKILYPSTFANDPMLEIFREWAIDELCFSSLKPVWEKAVYLYMAHNEVMSPLLFDVNNTNKASGNVKRHHTNDVETEFANIQPIEFNNQKGGLHTTVFGKALLALMRRYGGNGVLNTSQASIGGVVVRRSGGYSDGC